MKELPDHNLLPDGETILPQEYTGQLLGLISYLLAKSLHILKRLITHSLHAKAILPEVLSARNYLNRQNCAIFRSVFDRFLDRFSLLQPKSRPCPLLGKL